MKSHMDRDTCIQKYKAHINLIKKRSDFENRPENKIEPYINFPTTMEFPNIDGWALIHLAAKAGNLEDVIYLVERKNVSVSLQTRYEKDAPLTIAMQSGYHQVAKYLIDKGATTADCDRDEISDSTCLQHYDHYSKKLLAECIKKNRLLSEILPGRSSKTYLHLLVEMGKFNLFKNNEQAYFIDLDQDDQVSLLHAAIRNNQLELVSFFIEKAKPSNIVSLLDQNGNSAIHVAAQKGNWRIIQILLNHGVDVNQVNREGNVALGVALLFDHKNLASNILHCEQKPNITILNYASESLLHILAKSNINYDEFLKENPELCQLLSIKNIYGYTPDETRDFLIKQRIKTAQGFFIPKIIYYHKIHYRSLEFISEDGYCNGLIFLWHYYNSKSLDLFQTLELLSNWSGYDEHLTCSPPAPLDKEFTCIKEVFENFISVMTAFQQWSEISGKTFGGSLRKEQLAVFFKSMNVFFYPFQLPIQVNKKQLKELLLFFTYLPKGMRIELHAGEHATGFKIVENNKYAYYDPNFHYSLSENLDFDALVKIIINFKYKLLGKMNDDKCYIDFIAYRFSHEMEIKQINNIFKTEELPQSEEAEKLYIKNSPNGFNPLYVSILTHSIDNIKEILRHQHSDILLKIKNHETPLMLAMHTGNHEIICALLDSGKINSVRTISSMCKQAFSINDRLLAYKIFTHSNACKLFDEEERYLNPQGFFMFDCPSTKTAIMNEILTACLENNDSTLINQIIIDKQNLNIKNSEGVLWNQILFTYTDENKINRTMQNYSG